MQEMRHRGTGRGVTGQRYTSALHPSPLPCTSALDPPGGGGGARGQCACCLSGPEADGMSGGSGEELRAAETGWSGPRHVGGGSCVDGRWLRWPGAMVLERGAPRSTAQRRTFAPPPPPHPRGACVRHDRLQAHHPAVGRGMFGDWPRAPGPHRAPKRPCSCHSHQPSNGRYTAASTATQPPPPSEDRRHIKCGTAPPPPSARCHTCDAFVWCSAPALRKKNTDPALWSAVRWACTPPRVMCGLEGNEAPDT